MAVFGLGNFHYEISYDGKVASYKFFDPEDETNAAETTVASKDIVGAPDSRDTAEVAYAQCAQLLNDKRDKRLAKAASDADAEKVKKESEAREREAQFQRDFQDVQTAPAKVEKDGTRVYNVAPPPLVNQDSAGNARDAKADK